MGKQSNSKKRTVGKPSAAAKHGGGGKKFTKATFAQNDVYDDSGDELTGKQKMRANANDKYSQNALKDMNFDADDGKVLYGDDESIDSDGEDIGWNSDDDAAFGSLIKSKKSSKAGRGSDESEDEVGSDDEAGGTLLSDMLAGFASSSNKGKPSSSSKADDALGEFFDDDDMDSDQSENESEGGHADLLSAVEKFTKTPDATKAGKNSVNKSNQFAPESEFSATDPSKLSISTLLGALEASGDVRGLSAVKTKLADLEKSTSAPKAVNKVISERVERSIAYSTSKADMNKWQSTVVANRNASTLDLAGDKRQLPSYKGLIEKFETTTDLERDINMVLVDSNGYEDDALQDEEDALAARHATPEQMKENLGELAKIRALMFYEQMKRHRLNKIKSKAYHRIRNRQNKRKNKDGENEADSDAALSDQEAEQEAEEAAAARVKERMNLKHQNTTRWAKMAQQYGKGNKDLRMAYHESVQLGHDLAKKVDRVSGQDDDGAGGFESSDDEGGSSKDKIVKQLRGIISGDTVLDAEDSSLANTKYKKLFDMDFMKNAKNRQQDKAREEATSLLREIQEMEQSDDEDNEGYSSKGRSNGGAANQNSASKLVDKERQALAKQQMEALFSSSAGKLASAPTTKPVAPKKAVEAPEDSASNPWLSGIGQIDKALDARAGAAKKKAAVKGAIKVAVPIHAEAITTAAAASTESKGPKNKHLVVKMAGKKQRVVVTPVVIPAMAPIQDLKKKDALKMDMNEPKKQILLQKSQEEMVKEAFAGPDYEADFQTSKQMAVDSELDIDTKQQRIINQVKPGWGDWAGNGLSGVSEKTLKTRKRQLENLEEENAQKRVARKDGQVYNVMISDRRVKANSKYKLAAVPHPFTSREEYERSIQMPLGEEWNASHIVRRNTKPEIMLRAGRIVAPIKLSKDKTSNIKSNRRGLQ